MVPLKYLNTLSNFEFFFYSMQFWALLRFLPLEIGFTMNILLLFASFLKVFCGEVVRLRLRSQIVMTFFWTVLQSTLLTILRISAQSAQPVWLYIFKVAIKIRITNFCCHFRPLSAYKISHRCQVRTKFCIDFSNPLLWRSWKFQLDRSSQLGCTFPKCQ